MCIIGALGFIFNAAIFYPGYMSNDTITQLSQVLGIERPDNMLPLAMVGVWRVLIEFTHHVSSMMLFQLVLLWLSLTLLALYIYRETNVKKRSLLPFAISILPFVLNISGVVWKDNQMAFSLLLGCVVVLYFKYLNVKKGRAVLLFISLALMIYASLVRYNAIIAIIPLMYLAVSQSKLFKKQYLNVLATLGVVGITAVGFSVIGAVMDATRGNPIAFVMIDDVANVAPISLIESTNAPNEFKNDIKGIKECALNKDSLVNNYWICSSSSQRSQLQSSSFSSLKHLWVSTILTHPFDYGLFKLQAFASFLLPSQGNYYVWQNGIESNNLNQNVKYKRLGAITSMYVNNLGYRYLSFMYEPWFWAVVCSLLITFAYREKMPETITAIVVSAGLYILSYLPTGATVDYRFIYWSVIACLVGVVLTITVYPNTLRYSTTNRKR